MKKHYPTNEDKLLEPDNLARCPFCHSRHLQWCSCEEEGYYTGKPIELFYMQCNKCGARGPVTTKRHPETAHKLWNLR